ncbi:TPA: hypothetical protein ACYQFJ_002173 [Streptococcus pneumoniae]
MKFQILRKESLNETNINESFNYYHVVIYDFQEEHHIYIKNTDYFKDDIKKISEIKSDVTFYNTNSEEFKILKEAILKFKH